MRVLVTVGEEGGFAAASRKLDVSPAAVTRAIAGLEKQLGVKLILRTTRNIRFTEAGSQFYDDCKSILAKIAEANEAVSGANKEPQGTLYITAPVLFGQMFVMPCIVTYMQQYPRVRVVANFVDRVTNLVEEGIDVAIRVGPLPNSTLRAIKVGQVRRVLCASPSYISTHGTPVIPADLNNHTLVSSSSISPKVEWRFKQGENEIKIEMDPRLVVTSNEAAVTAALSGLGVARLLSYQIRNEVDKGNLRLLLEEFEEEPWPVHIVHREDKYGSSKVRIFINAIVDYLRTHPSLKF